MAYTTPQEALVGLLLSGSTLMPGIVWGNNASPFYGEVPETPVPAFPYFWFDIPDSTVNHTFGYSYYEEFVATCRVYCREVDIAQNASPYVSTTPFYFLDSYAKTPRILDGANYQGMKLSRKSWRLYKDAERGPDVGRVWIAEAKYDIWFTT